MTHDFRRSFLNIVEKLFRQRGYWNHLRTVAERSEDEASANTIAKVIADLDFVLTKALETCPSEVISEVHELVRVRTEERTARYR